ncbi:MAG: hypothetical protein A3G81_05910 [Betaproteobacteria bacterium RIFCSPLOWO2_12_FULL_65_14]|nr:MAG: hypothetical protein A3G81_05910 [Betaproteobacteria bacterium RIFCSPLOWO2_12_FULL_65_14]
MEASLAHPIYDAVRPWREKLGTPSLDRLNALAEEAGLRTESGRALRFVPPGTSDAYYEIRVYESGCVATRPDNLHDLFNALAWLAFPRTKARVNALHAAAIPGERGKRGPKRDLLTLFDEGGAMIECGDPELVEMAREFRWKELFWQNRSRVLARMRFVVIGHAVLEKALAPWPGIACKALPIRPGADPDAQACAWLGRLPGDATPRALLPLPVFGYPGWMPGNDRPEFYDDTRYFRPFKRLSP